MGAALIGCRAQHMWLYSRHGAMPAALGMHAHTHAYARRLTHGSAGYSPTTLAM